MAWIGSSARRQRSALVPENVRVNEPKVDRDWFFPHRSLRGSSCSIINFIAEWQTRFGAVCFCRIFQFSLIELRPRHRWVQCVWITVTTFGLLHQSDSDRMHGLWIAGRQNLKEWSAAVAFFFDTRWLSQRTHRSFHHRNIPIGVPLGLHF